MLEHERLQLMRMRKAAGVLPASATFVPVAVQPASAVDTRRDDDASAVMRRLWGLGGGRADDGGSRAHLCVSNCGGQISVGAIQYGSDVVQPEMRNAANIPPMRQPILNIAFLILFPSNGY